MTAPAFTPAPWRRIGHRTIAADRGGRLVAICEVFYGAGPLEEADANEALIAAAPALYLAAAEVAGWIDAGFLTVGVLADTSPARVEACGRALDALADALRLAVPGVAP
ncbi:hypothetical protein [uncultured Zoogloea sp.]|uniref:hypothetical protein n=1 Tax=uncultured Zoogloea sp. TaxID=160237 RepID=UPI0026237738|nr:hypothetical protein [uncultured Zoogloea sp.]